MRFAFPIAAAILLTTAVCSSGVTSAAEEEASFEKPDFVYNIARENTHSDTRREAPYLEPSELTETLLESTEIPVENPGLISLFNESTIKGSKFAFGFDASIYLGSWALSYDSKETDLNWEYEKINSNEQDNRGGEEVTAISYKQLQNKTVAGELSSSVPEEDDVETMMRIQAGKKTMLPLSFGTTVGAETKIGPSYQVQPKQLGVLHSYVPAVHEKGTITYGEVYVTTNGREQEIVIKNVQKQAVDAWIPVKNHVTLKYVNA